VRLRLVARVRPADPRDAGEPRPAPSADRAPDRLAAPARLLRLHAGRGQAAGAAGIARSPPGAAGVDPVPRQGDPDHRARQPAAEGSGGLQEARRGGRGDLYPQLHVLPRRQPRREGPLRLRLQPPAGELPGSGHDRDAPGGVPLLAHRQGRAGAPEGIHALEFGHARLGGPPERGADLAGHHVPLRRDWPAAAPLGRGALMSMRLSGVGILLALWFFAGALPAPAQAGDATAGKAVYEQKCLECHGEKGDGKGPAAELLAPRPRDFTAGLYKIRTTANKVPTDQDLFRVITDGMPGTSMPSWAVLPEKGRWKLVAYIKSFAADKFKEAPKKLELPKEVASSAESIKRGKEMFEAIEGHKCHGTEGRADGPSRAELKDEWGHPIPPANLTKRWTFRGGSGRTEIATRLANGVLGTPMPAFLDSVEKPEDIWHLTNFILSLGPESPHYTTLISVTATTAAIPDDPNADLRKTPTPRHAPLMGGGVVPPRNFNPAIDLVAVRAMYNDKEVAFHLTWDDPTQSADEAVKKLVADGISLQFPPQITAGTERPYFLMGDASDAVYLLRWENA